MAVTKGEEAEAVALVQLAGLTSASHHRKVWIAMSLRPVEAAEEAGVEVPDGVDAVGGAEIGKIGGETATEVTVWSMDGHERRRRNWTRKWRIIGSLQSRPMESRKHTVRRRAPRMMVTLR